MSVPLARWRPAFAVVLVLVVLVPAVAAAHPQRAERPSTYTVRPGDTLSEIAARHGSTVSAIAAANELDDPDRIVVGQVLRIPRTSASPGTAHRYHVVRRGETLSEIAGRYGLGLAELAAMNGIVDRDRVLVGARLRVSGGAPATASTPRGGGTHTVASGETLSEIARRYGISVGELASANGISDVDHLRAGQRLTVPGWRCPVAGRVRFSNDYGVAKRGGRYHEGIDLYAGAGTPVVASVPGRVDHVRGRRGGLQYWLYGDDGDVYIGTHLSRFGTSGRVGAGAVVGYVGSSGNAVGGPPHLHFEHHPGGSGPANPYPLLVRSCR